MKNFSELIKDLNKSPRGKAILFFVGYAFFFVFLIIFVRVMGQSTASNIKYDEANKYNFSVSNIINDNYAFKHSVNIDGVEVLYEGQRLDDQVLFKMITSTGSYDYYRNMVDYFSNSNGVWIKSNNPYTYYEFFEIENIVYLIDKSTLVYKTDYESGRRIYNFNISTTTIHKLFDGTDLDVADEPNEIIVTSDDRGDIQKIEFKLNSYCKVLGICNSDMNITLTYDKYGEIEKIDSPFE